MILKHAQKLGTRCISLWPFFLSPRNIGFLNFNGEKIPGEGTRELLFHVDMFQPELF